MRLSLDHFADVSGCRAQDLAQVEVRSDCFRNVKQQLKPVIAVLQLPLAATPAARLVPA